MDILDVADKAVRCTLGRQPLRWNAEDWEDARQEALYGILKARSEHEAIAFTAAKHMIYDWMRLWLRHPRGGTILDYLDYAVPEEDRKVEHTYLNDLRLMLSHVRSKNIQMKTVEEEIRYLELIMMGYSTLGIGMEMRLSRRRVYAIRERLLPRLRKIANDRSSQPPTE